MKLKLIGIIAVIVVSMIRCEKIDLEVDVPRCIEKEIIQFSKSINDCQEAQVLQLKCPDGDVYQFIPGPSCHDGTIKYYDSKCKLLCQTQVIDPLFSICASEYHMSCGNVVIVVWMKN